MRHDDDGCENRRARCASNDTNDIVCARRDSRRDSTDDEVFIAKRRNSRRNFYRSSSTLVARRLTPEEFGVPTVHFYLLSTAILTTREGFRRALMRDSVKDASLGYAWLVLPIGGFLSIVIPLGVIWSQNISTREPYGLALLYYGAAAFIELCAEPYYIRAMRMSAFKLRLFAETTSTVLRSVLTYALVSANQNNVVMAFAYSQVRVNFISRGN